MRIRNTKCLASLSLYFQRKFYKLSRAINHPYKMFIYILHAGTEASYVFQVLPNFTPKFAKIVLFGDRKLKNN